MAIEPITNSAPDAGRGGNDLPAVGYMLVAVLGFSGIPLLIAWGGAGESPFLFNSGFRLGTAVGCLVFLLLLYKPYLTDINVLMGIYRHVFRWSLLFIVLNYFEFAFFAWSIQYINIAITSVLYEIWPIITIFLMARLFRNGRYRSNFFRMLPLLTLALVGIAFVVFSSYSSELGNPDVDGPHFLFTFVGVGLAIVAAVAGSFTAFAFKWGNDLARTYSAVLGRSGDADSFYLFSIVVANVIGSMVSAPINAIVGLIRGETIGFGGIAMAIFISGALVHASSNIVWRVANLKTDNLGINGLAYTIPVLSLAWLSIFSHIEVARPDCLIIGTAAIITANLLINFEAEIRWGFKALILALGTCGAFVYLRDGIFDALGINQWNWGGDGYFESITLAATVFILLLAFRVTRLVNRTSEEDTRTFAVYRKLDMLARRGIINPQVCEYVLQIDRANNNSAAEQTAYNRARKLIADVDPQPLNEADAQLLSEAEAQLDALARSKQVDIHFGEMFALFIFGAVTAGFALLTRPPQVEGWPRMLVDLFAMLISSVVVFLWFHIHDLQRERDERKLQLAESGAEYRHYLARFLDTERRSFDQWISIIVGAAIVLLYAVLLGHKWLGWFSWLG